MLLLQRLQVLRLLSGLDDGADPLIVFLELFLVLFPGVAIGHPLLLFLSLRPAHLLELVGDFEQPLLPLLVLLVRPVLLLFLWPAHKLKGFVYYFFNLQLVVVLVVDEYVNVLRSLFRFLVLHEIFVLFTFEHTAESGVYFFLLKLGADQVVRQLLFLLLLLIPLYVLEDAFVFFQVLDLHVGVVGNHLLALPLRAILLLILFSFASVDDPLLALNSIDQVPVIGLLRSLLLIDHVEVQLGY